jgi:hypothetical protein
MGKTMYKKEREDKEEKTGKEEEQVRKGVGQGTYLSCEERTPIKGISQCSSEKKK